MDGKNKTSDQFPDFQILEYVSYKEDLDQFSFDKSVQIETINETSNQQKFKKKNYTGVNEQNQQESIL